MGSEKLATIIGIRVYPSWKKQMMEEAKKRGKTLSEYLCGLIESGRVQVANESRKPHTVSPSSEDFEKEEAKKTQEDGHGGVLLLENLSEVKDDTSDHSKEKSINKELPPEEFIKELKRIYTWVDFEAMEIQMNTYLFDHPSRQKTRQFLVKWINKWYPKPMEPKKC